MNGVTIEQMIGATKGQFRLAQLSLVVSPSGMSKHQTPTAKSGDA